MPKTKLILIALVGLMIWTARASAAPPRVSWLGPSYVESPIKVLHVRLVMRKLLGIGEPMDDKQPLRLGPAQALFAWQKGWRWSDAASGTGLPLGLEGGAIVGLNWPLGDEDDALSLQTRVSALRYVFANTETRRIVSDELANPGKRRHGFEAGLFLNIPLVQPR